MLKTFNHIMLLKCIDNNMKIKKNIYEYKVSINVH